MRDIALWLCSGVRGSHGDSGFGTYTFSKRRHAAYAPCPFTIACTSDFTRSRPRPGNDSKSQPLDRHRVDQCVFSSWRPIVLWSSTQKLKTDLSVDRLRPKITGSDLEKDAFGTSFPRYLNDLSQ